MDVRIEKSIKIIKYIINDLGIRNTNEFGSSIGLDRSESIYKILRGETSISVKMAKRINKKYPKYSVKWLRGGEDSSLKINLDSVKQDKELNPEEVLFVLESLFKHKKQLEQYEMYDIFVKELKDEARSEALIDVAKESLKNK